MKKYTIYAIGETVLVVVGILIALQINNWNEERKDRFTEKEVLSNLLITLKKDSSELGRIIEKQQNSLDNMKSVIEGNIYSLAQSINQDEVYDFVKTIANGGLSFFPKYGVYNNIVSSNKFEILQTDEIKNRLIDYFDYKCKRYENIDAIVDGKFSNELTFFLSRNFKLVVIGDIKETPIEFSLLEANFEELQSTCMDMYGICWAGCELLKTMKNDLDSLVQLINLEIDQ
jgi:hypothetical protein